MLANELKGSEKLTLQNFNPEHPLDPGLKKVKPYTDQEIKEMQDEMNQILKESQKPEGRTPFYSKPATRNP